MSRSPHSEFGAFYRKLKARRGPQKAIVATAHKIARAFYHVLTKRTPFCARSAANYEQRDRAREIARLQKKAAKLGCELVIHPA